MSNDSLPLPPADAAPDATPADEPDSVGVAECLADGTLRLMLRTRTGDGMIGEALMMVPPGDPRHPGILAHLGRIAPGESVPIKPFPPELDDDD